MSEKIKKHKKYLMALFLLFLGAGLVWAVAELAGQANSLAQDASGYSTTLEMISLKIIKNPVRTKDTPEPPPCDWKSEQSIRRALEANEVKYRSLLKRAKGKMGAQVPAREIMNSAAEFKRLCDRYAEMWNACGCFTRAELAVEAGNTRVTNATVAAGLNNADQLRAMIDAQNKMMNARRNYAIKAIEGDEIEDKDKRDIRNNIIPRIDKLMRDLTDFSKRVEEYIWQMQRQPAGGGTLRDKTDDPQDRPGGQDHPDPGHRRVPWINIFIDIPSIIQKARENRERQSQPAAPGDIPADQKTLWDQATALRELGVASLENSRELKSDAEGLAGGPKPGPRGGLGGPKGCFVDVLLEY